MSEDVVIICRSVKYGIVERAQTGFSCAICGDAVQLTEKGGLGRLRECPDSTLLCNDCGLLYVQIAEAQHKIDHYEMSPHAKAQMEAGNRAPLARFLRKHIF